MKRACDKGKKENDPEHEIATVMARFLEITSSEKSFSVYDTNAILKDFPEFKLSWCDTSGCHFSYNGKVKELRFSLFISVQGPTYLRPFNNYNLSVNFFPMDTGLTSRLIRSKLGSPNVRTCDFNEAWYIEDGIYTFNHQGLGSTYTWIDVTYYPNISESQALSIVHIPGALDLPKLTPYSFAALRRLMGWMPKPLPEHSFGLTGNLDRQIEDSLNKLLEHPRDKVENSGKDNNPVNDSLLNYGFNAFKLNLSTYNYKFGWDGYIYWRNPPWDLMIDHVTISEWTMNASLRQTRPIINSIFTILNLQPVYKTVIQRLDQFDSYAIESDWAGKEFEFTQENIRVKYEYRLGMASLTISTYPFCN